MAEDKVIHQDDRGSKVIARGDAALTKEALIGRYHAKPKGRVLRPLARLCGCIQKERGLECVAQNGIGVHDDRETEHEYRARIAAHRDVEVVVICTPLEDRALYGAAGRMWPRGQTRCFVHRDELEELRQEHGRIEVMTIAELHSRVQVPIPHDEDPVVFLERELAKAKAEKEAKLEAANPKPPPEKTPEVDAIPGPPAKDKGKK